MRFRVGAVVGCLLMAPFLAWGQAPLLERMDFVLRSIPDGPVARVNGANVSADDFRRLYVTELASWVMQARDKDIPNPVRMETALRCLTLLVQRELLFQEAVKRKITVSDADLEKAWDDEIAHANENIGDDKDAKPLTEQDILERTGMTKAEALQSIRREMLIDQARDALIAEKGVKVADTEAREFFDAQKTVFQRPDKCHLKQIFAGFGGKGAKVDDATKSRAREKIAKALQRIRAGESFEGVAKAMSEAPDAESGGDMGMLPMTALPPFFVEAVNKMQPGQMSDAIESSLGVHLIRLVAVEAGAEADFEKDKPIIQKMLMTQKGNDVVDEFCKPVFDSPGVVQVYLELEKTLDAFPAIKEEIQKAAAAASGAKSKP